MPTPTQIALATVTLTSTDSEIQFSSIPNTYRDLMVVASFRLSTSGVVVSRVNGSSSNFSRLRMMGALSLGAYQDFGSDDNIGEWYTADEWGTLIINIMDYATTNKNKSILARSSGFTRVVAYASRWASNTAVNSYSVATNQAFSVGSTFTLYGIAG